VSLADHPGFDALTSAQREEIQDWYARRYLATRDLRRRTIRRVPYYLPEGQWPDPVVRFAVDRPSPWLREPPTLRAGRGRWLARRPV
jgi:hypothetical protein